MFTGLFVLMNILRRIAIHQAVVPTIDEETKEELSIDTIDTTPFAMFGVFDGHGGPACAEVQYIPSSVTRISICIFSCLALIGCCYSTIGRARAC